MKESTRSTKKRAYILFSCVYMSLLLVVLIVFIQRVNNNKFIYYKLTNDAFLNENKKNFKKELLEQEKKNLKFYLKNKDDSSYLDENQFEDNELLSRGGYLIYSDKSSTKKATLEELEQELKKKNNKEKKRIKFYKLISLEDKTYKISLSADYIYDTKALKRLTFKEITRINIYEDSEK